MSIFLYLKKEVIILKFINCQSTLKKCLDYFFVEMVVIISICLFYVFLSFIVAFFIL
ncbi:hypothetical protein IGK49_000125 [Enterococcus sp. AZ029]